MADANVDSVQQSQDAQNLDNLTSLQQADSTTVPQPTSGTADATVTTTNPPAPDTPSLYNDAVGTNNNQTNLEAAGTTSLLDTTTFTNDGGATSTTDTAATSGVGAFGTEVNTGNSQVQYTVTNEAPVVQGASANGTQNTVGSAQGGAAAITIEGSAATASAINASATTTDAPVTNTTPAPTLNTDGTRVTDPTVDPIATDPTPQEPVAVNDIPSFSTGTGKDAGGVTEDATNPTLTTTGTLTVTDADGTTQSAINTAIAPVASAGALGSLVINAAGEWTYTAPNANVQYLAAGETKVETFTVKSVDGTSHDITITITGINNTQLIELKSGAELRVDESSGVNLLSSSTLEEKAPNDAIYGQSLGQSTITYQNLVNDTTQVGVKTYTLNINSQNTPSGYFSSDGISPILLIKNGDVIEGKASGNIYFTLSVNKSNGDITFTDFKAIKHINNPTGDESSPGMLANAVKLDIAYTANGSPKTASIDIGSIIRIEDSSPDAVTVGASTSNKALDGVTTCTGSLTAGAGTSAVNFGSDGIGADVASMIISNITGVIQPVGSQTGTSISNVVWTGQDSTPGDGVISYKYSFDYQVPGSAYTQTGSGVITLSGSQYTITVPKIVDSVAYSTDNLAGVTQANYDLAGNKSPEIVVLSGSSTFSQVITGYSGSSGSNTDTLKITNGILTNTNQNYLNVSTNTLGVGDDTIQPDDLFNIDFYKTNPVSNNVISTSAEKSFVTNSVITIDQWSSGEDIAINLKLGKIDANGTLLTTNKFLVANMESDYVISGSFRDVSITKNAYSDLYNQGYRIIGMQIVSNTGDIVTTAYSLSNGSPVVLGSAGTNYQNTKDADIIKIVKIATVQEVTVANILKLNLEGQIVDADGNKSPTFVIGTAQSAAPVVLDLNGDGIHYVEHAAGVTHDYNHDGVAESTAWVAPEDGLLALQKEDGTHNIVFSTQAGETDLAGLAKVYDSNKDGILDAKDADFAKFGVWQDANSDGIVQNGEFLTLADRGITSLSLTSDGQVHFEANGDVIVYGQTTYTTNDGQLHIAEDVGFAVSDVHEPLDIAAIIANADAIESVTHIDQLAETASSSSLMVELGGQTYEIATLAGQELGTHDILTQFVGGDTTANLLTNKSWTDVIDIASDHGGPGAIIAAGGTLDEGAYANGEGDWTVVINSGDAKVDATNNQITFSSDSAENSVTITTADGSSHNIDNVDKIQWHG